MHVTSISSISVLKKESTTWKARNKNRQIALKASKSLCNNNFLRRTMPLKQPQNNRKWKLCDGNNVIKNLNASRLHYITTRFLISSRRKSINHVTTCMKEGTDLYCMAICTGNISIFRSPFHPWNFLNS